MQKPIIIDPLEFSTLFIDVNRIAFIGNGAGVMGTGLGSVIDRSDLVVRFNLCRTFGFEKDVGTKTSIFITNGLDRDVREPLENRCSISSLIAGVVIVPLEQLMQELTAGEGYHIPDLEIPYLVSFATLSNLDYLAAANGVRISKWTTGTYAIYLLSTLLKPKEILLSGFDLFCGTDLNVHYYDPKSKGRARANRNHDLESESELWELLLENLSCRISASSDILNVMPNARGIVRAL